MDRRDLTIALIACIASFALGVMLTLMITPKHEQEVNQLKELAVRGASIARECKTLVNEMLAAMKETEDELREKWGLTLKESKGE